MFLSQTAFHSFFSPKISCYILVTYNTYFFTIFYFTILYFRTRFLLILEIQYFSLFFSVLSSLATPTRKYNLVRDFFTFEIPARDLYCPVTISGLNLKLIYCKQTTNVLLICIIRTVRLPEISCCFSHLVCQLPVINFFLNFD